MKSNKDLSDVFLTQNFEDSESSDALVNYYRQLAKGYSQTENAIVVLSDLMQLKSYIYWSDVAKQFDFKKAEGEQAIPSIWEDDIFSLIHPDDVSRKHLAELCFFNFLKGLPKSERRNYFMVQNLRFRKPNGQYSVLCHRIFYVYYQTTGAMRFAMCLYNNIPYIGVGCCIVNSLTGELKNIEEGNYSNILSEREKEVLQYIDRGTKSKDIAEALFISIHTVSRHRQNILQKLNARNSAEACQLAKQLNLISD